MEDFSEIMHVTHAVNVLLREEELGNYHTWAHSRYERDTANICMNKRPYWGLNCVPSIEDTSKSQLLLPQGVAFFWKWDHCKCNLVKMGLYWGRVGP